MRVLLICGVFAKENISEVAENAIGIVEYSANIFQEKLISGLKKIDIKLDVISAPFIGAYPMRSKKIVFRGFKSNHENYCYVPFVNVWGYRNISRTLELKRTVKEFIEIEDEKMVVVYSAHTPFLETARFIKKNDPKTKICFIVPDLPQYMNLDKNKNFFYDVTKKIDILRMTKSMEIVDTFMILTSHMKKALNIGKRPYFVTEGILDSMNMNESVNGDKDKNDEQYIVYTGKLNEKFGVKHLIETFISIENPRLRLILCGTGDCVPYIQEMEKQDKRILYKGQVLPEEAMKWQKRADVLVNPRMNKEEYTKYSFPSKNLEYLQTGNPVVGYMLDGMKSCYKDFMYIVDDYGNLAYAIECALSDDKEMKRKKYLNFFDYAKKNLTSESIAKKIIELG